MCVRPADLVVWHSSGNGAVRPFSAYPPAPPSLRACGVFSLPSSLRSTEETTSRRSLAHRPPNMRPALGIPLFPSPVLHVRRGRAQRHPMAVALPRSPQAVARTQRSLLPATWRDAAIPSPPRVAGHATPLGMLPVQQRRKPQQRSQC